MRRGVIAIAVSFALTGWASAAPPRPVTAAEKLVYKIDSVIATAAHGKVFIQVKGAVPSGGWKDVKLKLMHADPHAIVVDFVARPPQPDAPVIHGLLPVSADTVVAMRRGAVMVRVVSDANEMTTQILK